MIDKTSLIDAIVTVLDHVNRDEERIRVASRGDKDTALETLLTAASYKLIAALAEISNL